jgi:hypothetical protein
MLKEGGAQADTIREGLVAREIPAACRVVVEGYIGRANTCVEGLSSANTLHGLSDCLMNQLAVLTE